MLLAQARLVHIGPFEDISFPLCDQEGQPRSVTVVHGGGGVGKTALLSSLASTRPGHSVMIGGGSEDRRPLAICDWILGQDDPERPHPLRVITPNVKLSDDDAAALQRREQALFDRRARGGGHVFLAFSSTRWFSRQPIALHAPLRTVARYDVRATASLEDSTRFDLARETKQALAYSAITAALARRNEQNAALEVLGEAMRDVVTQIVSLAGFKYAGVDARSFEPMFISQSGRYLHFDALPNRARHLVAFAALPVRTLWAAYPGQDPRTSEGVVAIDEIDLYQDPAVQERLVTSLRTALPRVQWLITTTSSTIAASCDTREVLALRRLPDDEHVELYLGAEARTH